MKQKTRPAPEWGYLVQDPPYSGAPGGRLLTIWFRPQPTGRHFDPEKASFPIVERVGRDPTGGRFALAELDVGHPWEGEAEFRGAPGRVRAWDAKGREVAWFTFGGTLSVESELRLTVARFTSPAPIIEAGPEDEVILMLVEEAEELLAKRKAAHLADRWEGLADRVWSLSPWLLYCVVIHTLEVKFASLRDLPLEGRFWMYLHRQCTLLREEERCPRQLPPLEEIL